MSIILKGIDLPKEGEHIVALIKTNGKVSYFEQDIETTTCKIMKDTEAIQIPTPHGRLIDEKELLDKIKQGQYSEDINQVIYSVGADDIYNAPTILEAEE